jgi:uncharacterized Zn-binding protein involved in type VI secretion/N-acetyl-anhydromuramyl-L-alanine amidase AmpD
MSLPIITIGSRTSHGGTVIQGSPTTDIYGKQVARLGDITSCPMCKGTFPIIEGDMTFIVDGKPVALVGHMTACGATLLPQQVIAVVDRGPSAGRASAVTTTDTYTKAVANNSSLASSANNNSTDTEDSIKQEIFSNLEHGPLLKVNAIVLHRTGGKTAASALAAYKGGKQEGTHYLIDVDGTIYQTASLDKFTYHVGKLRSRAKEEGSIADEEKKEIEVFDKKYKGKSGYLSKLSEFEIKKQYPKRYPYNRDSIGIEVAGEYDVVVKAFASPTEAQIRSVARLVELLKSKYGLTNKDIYHHGEISYKDEMHTEGKNLGY